MINKDMLKHMKKILRKHGGEGSGNFDHAGRPGKVGGSQSKSGGGKNGNKVINSIQKWYKGDLSGVEIVEGTHSKGATAHVGYNEQIVIDEKMVSDAPTEEQEKERLRNYIERYKRKVNNPDATKQEKSFAKEKIKEYEDRIKNYVPYSVAKNRDDIIAHETGHIVADQLATGKIQGVTDLLKPSENPTPYKNTLYVRFKDFTKTHPVSEYGSSDFDEYFAESFVLYNRGEYEKIHPDMLQLFKRITK